MSQAMSLLRKSRFAWKFALGAVLLLLTFIAAMRFGAADTSLREVMLALLTNEDGEKLSILREIRLPREIGAVVVGAALAVAGAIMQGMTRNPLADPGLLGLTAGANAALAGTMALLPGLGTFGIMVACFGGAAVGTALVFGIAAMRKGGFSPFRLVLTGAAVSMFLYALSDGTSLLFKISKSVSMWTAGGLNGTSWSHLKVIVPFITVGLLVAFLLAKQVTILSMSEEVAISLGQNVVLVKIVLLGITILLAGASVALIGNLMFVGLLVPHLVRSFIGTDYRFIIPMSAIAGAIFMLLADTLARTINAPYETPVIAIAAVVGLPYFLLIVRKGGKTFS